MNREEVEACSRVAQKLAMAKQSASIHLREENTAAYEEIRELLGDCQEELAKICGCSPHQAHIRTGQRHHEEPLRSVA
jgi:hypothetical protein